MLKLKSLVAALTLGAALLVSPAAVDAAVRHHPTSTRTVPVKHKKKAAKKKAHRKHGRKATARKAVRKHAVAAIHRKPVLASRKTTPTKTVPVKATTSTPSPHHPLM